jgi:hypothetical protein
MRHENLFRPYGAPNPVASGSPGLRPGLLICRLLTQAGRALPVRSRKPLSEKQEFTSCYAEPAKVSERNTEISSLPAHLTVNPKHGKINPYVSQFNSSPESLP